MALRITYSDPIPPSPIRFIVDVLDLKTNEEYNKWMLQLERGATGVEFTLFSGTQNALRFASAVVEKSDGRTMFWKLDGNLQFGWKGRMLLYSATGIGTTKNKYEFGITLLDSPTGGRTRTAQLNEVLLIEFIEHAAYIGLINTLDQMKEQQRKNNS